MTDVHDFPLLVRWTHWLTHEAPRRLSRATIQEYRRQVVAFAIWLETTLGVPFEPASITPYRLEQYASQLHRQVLRKERKVATYNKLIVAFASFGAWLLAAGLSPEHPARRLQALAEQPSPPKALAPAIIGKLLDAAHHTGDLRDAVIVEILAHAGLRASEVAALQLEDLEVGLRTTWLHVLGKGQKQRRVPLPKHVGALIQDYLALRMAKDGTRPTMGPLLVGERGGVTRTTINRTVTDVAQRARLTEQERALVTPHAFRHTVATQLVRKRDLVTAADLLGHSSLSTTRRYSKPSSQELETAVEQLYEPL